MIISNPDNERRKAAQRRHLDVGPPAGVDERRINIERRLFNLDVDCVEEWPGNPPHSAMRITKRPND